MNVTQRLLEIEILVFFLGSNANVASRRETAIGSLDLFPAHQFHESRYGPQFRLGEAVVKPSHLPMKIHCLFELFHCGLALLVDLLYQLARRATVVSFSELFV